MLRMIRRFNLFGLIFRIVVDDQFDRVLYGDSSVSLSVKNFSEGAFQHRVVNPCTGLFRNADAFTEESDRLRRVAAAAKTDECRHARVIPAVDQTFFDERDQFALAHDHIS